MIGCDDPLGAAIVNEPNPLFVSGNPTMTSLRNGGSAVITPSVPVLISSPVAGSPMMTP